MSATQPAIFKSLTFWKSHETGMISREFVSSSPKTWGETKQKTKKTEKKKKTGFFARTSLPFSPRLGVFFQHATVAFPPGAWALVPQIPLGQGHPWSCSDTSTINNSPTYLEEGPTNQRCKEKTKINLSIRCHLDFLVLGLCKGCGEGAFWEKGWVCRRVWTWKINLGFSKVSEA